MNVAGLPAGRRLAALGPLAVVAALAVVPLAVVLASILDPTGEVWAHLWRTRLPGMLRSTATLVVLVGLGSLAVGTALAWLVSAYRFPGRRVLGWALAVPLVLPGYVTGFVWLDTLDYAGPVQTWWRERLGDDAWFPDVRSLWLCALVLIGSLYPYVYLLARAAFREQSAVPVEVARTLGCSRAQAFRRVVLPMARPSLAAGTALVVMETLTDVGTVRLFNVQTVADGVFRVWFGLADRQAATELAGVLVLAGLAVILAERGLRGRARFDQRGGRDRPVEPVRLRGWRAWSAAGGLVTFVAVVAGVPLWRLAGWAAATVRAGEAVTVSGGPAAHTADSLRLAAVAVVACLTIGLVVTVLARHAGNSRLAGALARVVNVGYAVPGPVVAVGVLVVLTALDRRSWLPGGVLLMGSFAGLVYALIVRYLAVAHQSLDASFAKVTPALVASARTLGERPWGVTRRVELPLVRPGLLAAAALVGIDVFKELPVTLVLRPFGLDTLPVWVWQATSESLWEQAAVPSLLLAGLSSILLVVLLVLLERGEEVRL